MKRNLLFIVNPVSGVGRQNEIEQLIDANLDFSLFDREVVYTAYAHHGKELTDRAKESGLFDAIVAVGGDGSVNDVASSLYNPSPDSESRNLPALGIIPCGSGNGLARNLKIPLNPAHAIKALNQFKVADIDTIQLNNRVVASIAGIGFDAHVARRMKLAKVRGFQAYAKIIATDYFSYKEHTYRLSIDGQEMEHTAWFISFANSNQFGYNTAIAPHAKLDDGLIDVCIVSKIPFHHLPLSAPLIYFNHFELSQHAEIFKAHEITVYNNEGHWVNIDGEGEKTGSELHLLNIPKSLKILTP